MRTVHPRYLLGRLDRWDIKVHDNWFLSATHKNTFERLIPVCVDLLMGNVGRDINEVARTGFSSKLQSFAPTHSSPAFHNVDHAFELAVMMRSRLCVCVDGDGSRPQFAGACPSVSDRRGTIHSLRLRCVRIEFARTNYANAFVFPVGFHLVVRTIQEESVK